MSENSITVVELSATGSEAEARAVAVRDWLLATGVIVPNTDRDDLWQPSEFVAGPNAATVFPDPSDAFQVHGLANNGVDVVTERQIFHPVENYTPPSCPSCGTAIDDEEHEELMDDWLDGIEPSVTCSSCAQAALIGDWVGEFTFQIGDVAVVFNNWPPLTPEFLADLGSRLGPRWRVVYEHT